MHLEEKYALKYMRDTLVSLTDSANSCEVENAKYHHNTDYYKAASVIQRGILSINNLNKLGIGDYSSKSLNLMSDIDSHVNGVDGVSLAVVGLTDLYPDEEEYNPFNSTQVDFLVDSEVRAFRTSTNYGNEFVSRDMICPSSLRAIDIRLLEYIDSVYKNDGFNARFNTLENVIEKYNCIGMIARALEQKNLNIPIRERSYNQSYALDVKRLVKIPKLTLKDEDARWIS